MGEQGELNDLRLQLQQNEEQQSILRQEENDLCERIKKLEDRIHNVENANKKTDHTITKLQDAILDIKNVTIVMATDVGLIKTKLSQQNPEQITQELQAITRVVFDLKNQIAQLVVAHQTASNKKALHRFNSSINALVLDILKGKDTQLERLFNDTLNSINGGWRDRVNSNSSEDVSAALESLTSVLTQDIKSFLFTYSKYYRPKLDEVNRLFNEYISLSRYAPPKAPSAQSNGKATEQEFVLVGNGTQHQASHPPSSPKSPLSLYYDVDENEVAGLVPFIGKNFPTAQKYSPGQALSQPCVIMSFIAVHDRLDMNRWAPLCDARMKMCGEKHFVILVCNKQGDAINAIATTDKLAGRALYKCEFSTQFDLTGMNKGKPRQIFNEHSGVPAVSAIKAFIQQIE